MTHGKTMGTAKPSWLPAEADGHRAKHDIEFYRALDQASPRVVDAANWQPWRPDRDFMPFAPVSRQVAAGVPDLEASFPADSVPWGKPADKAQMRTPVPVSDLRRAFAPVVFATAFALGLLNHGAIADKAMQLQGRTVVASSDPIPDAPFSLSGVWRRLPVMGEPQARPATAVGPAAERDAPALVRPVSDPATMEPAPPVAPLQPGAVLRETDSEELGALDRHYVPIALDAICDIPMVTPAMVRADVDPPARAQVLSPEPVPVAAPRSAAIETAALVTPPTVHGTPAPMGEPVPQPPTMNLPSPAKAMMRGHDAVPSTPANRAKQKAAARKTPVSTGTRPVAEFAGDFAGNFGLSTRGFEAIRRNVP